MVCELRHVVGPVAVCAPWMCGGLAVPWAIDCKDMRKGVVCLLMGVAPRWRKQAAPKIVSPMESHFAKHSLPEHDHADRRLRCSGQHTSVSDARPDSLFCDRITNITRSWVQLTID